MSGFMFMVMPTKRFIYKMNQTLVVLYISDVPSYAYHSVNLVVLAN